MITLILDKKSVIIGLSVNRYITAKKKQSEVATLQTAHGNQYPKFIISINFRQLTHPIGVLYQIAEKMSIE